MLNTLKSSGLFEHTNVIIKTQLVKFVKTLQISWPKPLPLVLLNLRSPLLKLMSSHPLRQSQNMQYTCPCLLWSTMIKGKILYYYKGLIASIRNNHDLVEQSFHNVLPGGKDLKYHTLQPGDFIYWRGHFQKDPLHPHWKGPWQVLPTTLVPPNSRE